jgi:hypothetical protein
MESGSAAMKTKPRKRVTCFSCSRRRIKYADGLCETCHRVAVNVGRRLAIIFDGARWHVRSIRLIEHDLDLDEKIYRCDKPISNDHRSIEDAVASAKRYQRVA